jgi:hypothetical protein
MSVLVPCKLCNKPLGPTEKQITVYCYADAVLFLLLFPSPPIHPYPRNIFPRIVLLVVLLLLLVVVVVVVIAVW